MTPLAEAMFWLANALIVPVWGMMWFLPDHDLTKRYIGDLKLTFLPLLVPYLVLALPVLPDLLMTLGTQMPTPAVVVELFEDPDMVVLAWIHILALDTLAGRHIWRRMLLAGRPRAVSFPVLLFCLLLGPLGFAAGMALTWNVEGSDLASVGETDQKAQDSSTA